MKYFFLTMVLVLSVLLSACNDNKSPSVSSDSGFSPAPNANSGYLDEFVWDINNHQFQSTLDLFDDSASFTEINQVYLGTTVPDKGLDFTVNGKAEIENWLETQTGVIQQIVPVEYKLSGNIVSLDAVFYYPNQIQNIRIDAKTSGNKIGALYFFIEQIKAAL